MKFVNICPICGVHSFFSPFSLELHKNICSQILLHESLTYQKLALLTEKVPKYEHTAELEEKVELKISSEIEKIEEIGTETEISSAISEPSGTNSIFSQGPSFPSIEVAPFSKKTTCRICNKKFRNKFQLECHVKQSHDTSQDSRPHKCPLCPARFKVSGTLVTHLRTHTGEKPFSCNDCGKTFSQKSALTRHRMIHTGEKPFQCMFCFQKFRYKDALQSHEYKMHKEPVY